MAFRNQAIEAVIDPEGTLPKVTFVDRYERSPRQTPDSGIDNHNFAVFTEGGVEIARAAMATPYGRRAEKEGDSKIDIVEIAANKQEDYKGKGYGKAIYMELLKRLPAGIELACDGRGVSPDAYKKWQWLESLGIAARPAELGEPVLDTDGSYKNLGYKTRLSELAEFASSHSS